MKAGHILDQLVDSAKVSALCPLSGGAEFLGAGTSFNVTLLTGCYYHFRLSCDCPQGLEKNMIIYYSDKGIEVTVPEPGGSAWRYSYEPTQDEVCQPEYLSISLPSFLNVPGVQPLSICPVTTQKSPGGMGD